MKAVIQRVSSASVSVDVETAGQISKGFLVLLGVQDGDTEDDCDALAHKIAGLRIFCDSADKMNLSLSDVDGGVLVISNFTLCADCVKGRRPNFIAAAQPMLAEQLYLRFCSRIEAEGISPVARGVFGADMRVSLVNDGPVTLIIDSRELRK